jgi:hypothetical protein
LLNQISFLLKNFFSQTFQRNLQNSKRSKNGLCFFKKFELYPFTKEQI